MKPTRTFTVCTAPVVVTGDKGEISVLQPALLHEVTGCELKYIEGANGIVHIIDSKDSVVFSAPMHLVLWVKQEVLPPHLKLVMGDAIDV